MYSLETKVFHCLHQNIKPINRHSKKDINGGVFDSILDKFQFDSTTGLFLAEKVSCFSQEVIGRIQGSQVRFYDGKSDVPGERELEAKGIFAVKDLFIGEIKETEGILEIEGVDFYGKTEDNFLYNPNVLESVFRLGTYQMMREMPSENALKFRIDHRIGVENYPGKKEFVQRFHNNFDSFINGPGKKYVDWYVEKDKRLNEYRKQKLQDENSVRQGIFPSMYLQSANSNLYLSGAENEIYKNIRPISDSENLVLGSRIIKQYRLSDVDAMFVSKFLGCDPLKSEECYSILRHASSNKQASRQVLGISACDLRDIIVWTIDPLKC